MLVAPTDAHMRAGVDAHECMHMHVYTPGRMRARSLTRACKRGHTCTCTVGRPWQLAAALLNSKTQK